MDAESHQFQHIQTLTFDSTIVSISSCAQYFAVGCLDNSLKVWKNKFDPFHKEPVYHFGETVSGLTDLCFMQNSTHVATISIDSILRVWDLDTSQQVNIQTQMFSAFKAVFVGDSILTCGQLGKLCYYDFFSKEMIRKVELGETYLTAITVNKNQKKAAVGSLNGNLYVFNAEDGKNLVNIRPHFKGIRSATFTQDSNKIIAGSDDQTISITDLQTQQKQQSLQGHMQKVTSAKPSPLNPHLIYSCSIDKTVRIWDVRANDSIYVHKTNAPLWSLETIGRNVLTGGETGVLHIFKAV